MHALLWPFAIPGFPWFGVSIPVVCRLGLASEAMYFWEIVLSVLKSVAFDSMFLGINGCGAGLVVSVLLHSFV